jgi:hypothetical protein
MTLSIWYGERIEGILATGRTRPLLVSCMLPADKEHAPDTERPAAAERRTMVTKALGLPELTETHLFAEYFGSVLALEFGIDAPRAVLVDLGPELLAAAEDQLRQWAVRPRAGRAVGLRPTSLSQEIVPSAAASRPRLASDP